MTSRRDFFRVAGVTAGAAAIGTTVSAGLTALPAGAAHDPGMAGDAFMFNTPLRSYDSRFKVPGNDAPIGKMTGNETRVIPLPNLQYYSGLTAAIVNLTVVETGSVGFLSVAPGPDPTSTSVINWFGVDQIFTNMVTTGITFGPEASPTGASTADASGIPQIHLTSGFTGTHVIVDLFGYYSTQEEWEE